jgi:3-oxoacyl-[acyl-carrier-protein] synthase-3
MSKGVHTKGVKIIGTGHYVPENILTNKELEREVDTSDKWIRENLGISERRIASKEQSTSDLATYASQAALRSAGINAAAIDTIILATSTPDRIAPASSTRIQANIGAVNASAFDLNAVCSGFIYALTVGSQLIRSGMSNKVLVIGADTFSRITDWTRRDCVFFGDGAGAVVLSESNDSSDFLCSRLYADGTGYEAFTVPASGSEISSKNRPYNLNKQYFEMNGHMVYETATKVIPKAISNVLEVSGYSVSDIDHVIPHQPSIAILKESARISGIPFSKFHTNMDKYANTSSATIPLLLSEVNSAGLISPGELVAFVAVGAGWTWGASLIRW